MVMNTPQASAVKRIQYRIDFSIQRLRDFAKRAF